MQRMNFPKGMVKVTSYFSKKNPKFVYTNVKIRVYMHIDKKLIMEREGCNKI